MISCLSYKDHVWFLSSCTWKDDVIWLTTYIILVWPIMFGDPGSAIVPRKLCGFNHIFSFIQLVFKLRQMVCRSNNQLSGTSSRKTQRTPGGNITQAEVCAGNRLGPDCPRPKLPWSTLKRARQSLCAQIRLWSDSIALDSPFALEVRSTIGVRSKCAQQFQCAPALESTSDQTQTGSALHFKVKKSAHPNERKKCLNGQQ